MAETRPVSWRSCSWVLAMLSVQRGASCDICLGVVTPSTHLDREADCCWCVGRSVENPALFTGHAKLSSQALRSLDILQAAPCPSHPAHPLPALPSLRCLAATDSVDRSPARMRQPREPSPPSDPAGVRLGRHCMGSARMERGGRAARRARPFCPPTPLPHAPQQYMSLHH